MMTLEIRPAAAADATLWLELVKAAMGEHYPARELYDLNWIAQELAPGALNETWVAAGADGSFRASVSILGIEGLKTNPIANLGRMLFRPDSLGDGSAKALLRKINELADQRGETIITRVSPQDDGHQQLFEDMGYTCLGYQPLKHLLHKRSGTLFYVRGAKAVLVTRLPLSESLPQVAELAAAALESLRIANPMVVRDGASGYPLQSDLKISSATPADYQMWQAQLAASNSPQELSGRFNMGSGHMRLPPKQPMRAFLGEKAGQIAAGLAFYYDEVDHCARLADAFSSDNISIGALMAHAVKAAQEQLGAAYVEADILATAPRLLKTAEQLGFVPVAYLPAFYCRGGSYADIVKMVKLNLPYSLDSAAFTGQSGAMVTIIDRNFEDQKLGLAIINLLRPLSMFGGLGDGELRKIARLFTQKLYRPGEFVFARGDSSGEAYIVLRGKINIQLERDAAPVAQLTDGKVFGELAFLDGAPRNAFAAAAQPSILLVVQRSAFADLARQEPHLGMVVMRNMAADLAAKLRHADGTLAATRKTGG
jgi:GNAT superfamily N-acetyltransferase